MLKLHAATNEETKLDSEWLTCSLSLVDFKIFYKVNMKLIIIAV